MKDLELNKELLKAIRESLASLALENDSFIDYDKLSDEEKEKIYKKLIKDK